MRIVFAGVADTHVQLGGTGSGLEEKFVGRLIAQDTAQREQPIRLIVVIIVVLIEIEERRIKLDARREF